METKLEVKKSPGSSLIEFDKVVAGYTHLTLLNELSLDARKGLAVELGCPADKMGDSAQMNMWLHKTVLQKLADNGGNIPQDLL